MGFLGEADISKSTLVCATEPQRFFSRGQIKCKPAPSLGPVFGDIQKLTWALAHLDSLTLICYDKRLDSYKVHPELRSHVNSIPSDVRERMEYNALVLIFHTFPKDPDLVDKLFAELGTSQLPQVRHVLRYLERPGFIDRLSPSDREGAFAGCLSSSGFSTLDWKLRVLGIAERILKAGPENSLLSAKLSFRRIVLSRLYPNQIKDYYTGRTDRPETDAGSNAEAILSRVDGIIDYFQPSDAGSNAFLGEMILFCAQIFIDQDNLSQASYELEKIVPFNPAFRSTEERRVLKKKTILQLRIFHFAGDFNAAEKIVEQLGRQRMFISQAQLYLSELIAVHCELGQTQIAMEKIPAHDYEKKPWLDLEVKGRRMSLAAAGAYLMKGLWILKNDGFYNANPSLQEAKAIYKSLDAVYRDIPAPGIAALIRYFSVAAGLAMIAHLEWWFRGSVTPENALHYWQVTLAISDKVQKNFGGTRFLEMIISYSMSNIASELGEGNEAIELINKAKSLYRCRQFHYLALGSIWFDLVQEWNARKGLCRVSVGS